MFELKLFNEIKVPQLLAGSNDTNTTGVAIDTTETGQANTFIDQVHLLMIRLLNAAHVCIRLSTPAYMSKRAANDRMSKQRRRKAQAHEKTPLLFTL